MKVQVVRKPLNLLTKKKSKVDRQAIRTVHFKRRWFERVGETMNDDLYKKVLDLTKTTGKFLYRSPKSEVGSVYGIKYGSLEIKVVYDAWTNQLITVLPRNSI